MTSIGIVPAGGGGDEENPHPVQSHKANRATTSTACGGGIVSGGRRKKTALVVAVTVALLVAVVVLGVLDLTGVFGATGSGENDNSDASTGPGADPGPDVSIYTTIYDTGAGGDTPALPKHEVDDEASDEDDTSASQDHAKVDAGCHSSFGPDGLPDWTVLRTHDADGSDFFGTSVALSGDTVVAGAIRDEHHGGSMGGIAYVFSRSAQIRGNEGVWVKRQKLVPSNGSSADHFGTSVAIDSDAGVIVVGASRDDDGTGNMQRSGSIYVFERIDRKSDSLWIEKAKLRSDDSSEFQYFGTAVAVRGDIIVVGAKGDSGDPDLPLESSGAAYVFERLGGKWIQKAKLSANDANAEDNFGDSVALAKDTIVVGAHDDDNENGVQSGSVYVFSLISTDGSWVQQAHILPEDGRPEGGFGVSVDISDDAETLVVGASRDDRGDIYAHRDAGSVYIFAHKDKMTWEEIAKLNPFDEMGDKGSFGFNVDISGDKIVVGAKNDNDATYNGRAAYIFIRDGSNWVQRHKRLPLEGDTTTRDTSRFGVAIDGSTVVVGAHGDDHDVSGSFSAYAIELC